MVQRYPKLLKSINKKSYFLFGPRGSGKSFFIRKQLKIKEFQYIDLLSSKTYLSLKSKPWELENIITQKIVVIDEIQRIPELLNEVHRLIEEKKLIFLLTGSSARKLKVASANLLAGRALHQNFHPFTFDELQQAGLFSLEKYLLTGGLPEASLSEEPFDYLYSYVDTYLKEEISAEALVRNLPNYNRFLRSAAYSSGELINFACVASDAQLSPNTVRDYYQILTDTLLGFEVEPFQTKKRKAIATSKYYFFDVGVRNTILNIESLAEKSDEYGKCFEHFIAQELKAIHSYKNIKYPLQFWRSKSQTEVDFILNNHFAIEVKSTENVDKRHLKGLLALKSEGMLKKYILISRDPLEKNIDGVQCLYYKAALQELWQL